MNENKLTSLLRSADLESVEQIAELSPVTDDATRQRIWQQIKVRKAVSMPMNDVDAESVEPAPERKPRHWLGFAAVAAAMLILMGTVIHTLQQMPSPRMKPGTAATQADEDTSSVQETNTAEALRQQLADANADERDRWQGHVIQADRIGNMQLYGVVPSGSVDSDGNDNLTVIYQDPDNESFAWIKYTRATLRELTGSSDPHITGKNLSTLFIGSSDMPKPEEHDGKTQFTVEMQFYRVSVIMTGTTTGELTELIRVLNNALDNRADDELPGTPEDYTFDDLTYQQAQESTGYLIPWEVMGFEELDSLMKLQSIRYHQYNKGNEVWRYLIVIYKGSSGSVRLTYLPGEFKDEALGDLNFADVPEVTFPITQYADIPRTNTGGDVPAYDFRFRNGDWNIHCEAEA
ncbi:MAG: hypothetical protein IKN55_08840, partial [Oscillospiraceae bacterium]|nr:hypothetical protein [Oscillospiraceae bacterium]